MSTDCIRTYSTETNDQKSVRIFSSEHAFAASGILPKFDHRKNKKSLIILLQGSIQQLTDFILSTPKRIVDSTRKTLYISFKTLCRSNRMDGRLLLMTLSIHEDIAVLMNNCGHGRSSTNSTDSSVAD